MKHKHEQKHDHDHERDCCCGHDHDHDHNHDHSCCCGHEHEHEHGCACGHEHEHEHGCACGCDHDHEAEGVSGKTMLLYALGIALTVVGFLPFLPLPVRLSASVAVYLFFGFSVFRDMLRGFGRRQIFTEFTLMCVASLGAFAIGEFADAAAVMLLYRLGESLSGGAYARSRKSLGELIALTPAHASVEREGEVLEVEPQTVGVGERILIRAGERVPLDGIVCEGGGSADTSSVTGEATPLSLYGGVACPSGAVLLEGSVTLTVTHRYEDSVVARLAEAVREASAKKSSAEKKIARFARVFTPAAFVVAAAIALIGTLISGEVAHWLRMGLTVLVIACPCSLLLSVPLAYFAGIGAAARHGIVFRGGAIMDRVARLDTLALDKTGTLTESMLSFDGVTLLDEMTESDFLQLSFDVLVHSPHVAARAYCERFSGTARAKVTELSLVSGRGVTCLADGKRALFGNAVWLRENGIAVDDCPTTAIFGALDGCAVGILHFSAHTKPHAAEALKDLRRLGVSRIAVISGDAEAAVAAVCREMEIDTWSSGQTPSDKLERLEALMEEKTNQGHGFVGFCGDGLNDSAVIARADVGIAMGACGSALTVQSADVVLMDDELLGIAEAIRIARKTERVANVSIALSLGMKLAVVLIGLLLAAYGHELPIAFAIVADVGAAVVAVLQSMRAAGMS